MSHCWYNESNTEIPSDKDTQTIGTTKTAITLFMLIVFDTVITMPVLELKNVSLKMNGRWILKNLNMEFQDGKVYAVVGPNGAGKSTLAYTIMGLDDYRDIDGDILFDGKSIKNLSITERAKLGIILAWQEPARYEGLRIRKFLMASAGGRRVEIGELLRKVGLPEEYADRAVDRTLSGGERKKLELASILAMKPKFAMLDEPDSGIDVSSLEKIFEIIRMLKEKGTTVVLITHSLTVLKQAEYAFLMCNGTVVEKGDVSKIIPFFEGKCIPCDHKNMPTINPGILQQKTL